MLQLIEGRNIDSVDPIFMKNPLFLHFIFWFLSEKCGDKYFFLGNRNEACEILDSFIYHKIHRQLDSRKIIEKFPAIDFQRALETKDKINIEHFGQILERFKRIKYLTVENNVPSCWIVDRILPTCHALKVMEEDESHKYYEHYVSPEFVQSDRNSVNIVLFDQAHIALKRLCETAVRFIFLFVTMGRGIDLGDILHHKMWKLHTINKSSKNRLLLGNKEPISGPILTHLSIIEDIALHDTALLALNKAMREGKLWCMSQK